MTSLIEMISLRLQHDVAISVAIQRFAVFRSTGNSMKKETPNNTSAARMTENIPRFRETITRSPGRSAHQDPYDFQNSRNSVRNSFNQI